MGCLSKLPPELYDLVLSELDRKALSALSKTCRSLRPVAERYLYWSISWRIPLRPYPQEARTDVVHLLLRTVLCRPELGAYVRHFQYLGVKLFRPWDFRETPFTTRDLVLVRRAVRTAGFLDFPGMALDSPVATIWLEAIEGGLTSAVLALLLVQFPALKSLDLDFDQEEDAEPRIFPPLRWFPFVGSALLSSTNSNAPAGRFLLDAKFSGRCCHARHPLHTKLEPAEFSGLFYLPALRSLELSHVSKEPFKWPRKPPVSHALTSLTFSSSHINLVNLQTWLRATPNLTAFSFHTVTECQWRSTSWLDCNKLKQILLQLKSSLKSLSISARYDITTDGDPNSGHNWGTRGQLGDLHPFIHLEHLRLPLTILLGTNSTLAKHLYAFLPSKLRQFCLINDIFTLRTARWTAEDAVLEMCEYVLRHSVVTPQLEKFQVSVSKLKPEYQLGPVAEACGTVGLSFDVVEEQT